MEVVVSEHRPVPLWQHMMVGQGDVRPLRRRGVRPVQRPGRRRRRAARRRADPGEPGQLLQAIANRSRRTHDTDRFPSRGRGRRAGGPGGGPGGRGDGPVGRARRGGRPGGGATRAEVLERLEREALLPAITFIFSRVGCEAAVGQLLAQNVRMVTDEEGERIRRIVEERSTGSRRGLSGAGEDLSVLGYWDFVDGLSRGYAAHHAGMLPTFREVVEELFTAGASARSSPPRRWPSGSTCPRAPSCSSGW